MIRLGAIAPIEEGVIGLATPECNLPHGRGNESKRVLLEIRKASQSRAFDWPMPGECMGEQHACEPRDMDGSAGPQRSRDSGALEARMARPTKKTAAF